MASLKERFYPESGFGGFTDVDGTVTFYTRVNALLTASATMVDFGCGRGAAGEDPIPFRRSLLWFKGRCERVIGLDVDAAGESNPKLDEFHLIGPRSTWPLEDDSVDLVLSDSVLEHLQEPDRFFQEAARTLRTGGYLCIRTTNRLGYVGLVSSWTPGRFRGRLLSRARPERRSEDTFPVEYRCNTVAAVRRGMEDAGFEAVVYGYEAEPSYLSFSALAYRLGVYHQRFAPKVIRQAIFAFGRKP